MHLFARRAYQSCSETFTSEWACHSDSRIRSASKFSFVKWNFIFRKLYLSIWKKSTSL